MSLTVGLPSTWESARKEPSGRVHDHPQVMRLALRDRLGQGLKVCLPGFVLLAQPLQQGLHEGRTLAEPQLLLLSCHGDFLFELSNAFTLFTTNAESSPR